MRFLPTEIPGVVVFEPEPVADERGWFARTFCTRELAAHGLVFAVAQAAQSGNRRRGTTRGLHFARGEAKIVSCPRGRIFDVAVELATGRHVAVELSGPRMLHIPDGVAHGFQTLEDDTLVSYLLSAAYDASLQRGVRWDDPALAIPWPQREGVTLSERDRGLPLLAEVALV